MEKNLEIRIPFPGFYETCLESHVHDECEDDYPGQDIPREVWFFVARHWAERFAEALSETEDIPELQLKFKAMVSPREYNYATDEIDATIDLRSFLKLRNRYKLDFERYAYKRLTPYDGFMPFYDRDVTTWGPVQEWEPPQTSLLLELIAGPRGTELLSDLDWLEDEIGYSQAVHEGFAYAGHPA